MAEYPIIRDVELFLDDKPNVFAIRQHAKQLIEKIGFPSIKKEAWKYTNISKLIKTDFTINNKPKECCCHKKNNDDYFLNICFCNGILHIENYNLPDGLIIDSLPIALYENNYKKYINKSYDLEKHPFAILNTAYIEQGVCICVTKNTKISSPIKINYKNTECNNQQNHIHNIFILEKNTLFKNEVIETSKLYTGKNPF
jgi:Fe-S cluster assembly protein SufD